MRVNYLDLEKQFRDEGIWNVIKEQLKASQFILGSEVERFELNFAQLCQTRFSLGVNSGTDALFLAMKALNIGAGDEVITVPNSFIATTGSIIAAGAKPVFVDVGSDYNINPELIEPAITPRTKAIIPVHLTGNPADMIRIMEIASKHNLFVIEDACQAVMATINNQPVGSFGHIGCFSLHPLKNLNVCGDAGVVTTNSEDCYKKIKLLRNHGLKNRDEIECFGYNSRLDTLQAAVANYVLQNLTGITEARRKNALIYDFELKEMADSVVLPPRKPDVQQVFHTYIIQVKDRKGLMDYLAQHGVETKIHYPIPINLQKPCQGLGYQKGDFPVCEKQAESILTLPVHQYLKEEEVYYVAGLIKGYYQ